MYLFWSESNTGADSNSSTAMDVLANRVDRFRWDGSTLTFDRPIIRFRAFQQDAGQTARGTTTAACSGSGPTASCTRSSATPGAAARRRTWSTGRSGRARPDDQFGGPAPDDAHLTGVIVRLNDDGTAPTDNPFFAAGAAIGGEVGANVQKLFAYGIRNSFGMAVDPVSGDLWEQENGDDRSREVNRVEPGMNSGWIQIMGPPSRVAQFKAIETTMGPTNDPFAPNGYFGLQQIRWLPTNIADTPEEALPRLFMLPGAHSATPS